MDLKFWRKKKTAQTEAPIAEQAVIAEAQVPEQMTAPASSEAPAKPVAVEIPAEFEPATLPKRSGSKGIRSLFSRVKFNLEDLEALEDILIQADFGVDAAEALIAELRAKAKLQSVSDDKGLRALLVEILTEAMTTENAALNLSAAVQPYVFLVVGVNGVGKTTTIGKLSQWLIEGGWSVIVGAADTFRAAAVEQLATWASRSGAKLIGPQHDGQDPAAVAFQAVEAAVEAQADVVIIDTAGRLQNKTDLMNELAKVRRVVEKQVPIAETLLVIDATTGQNGLEQAKAFAEIANVTGIVLTKLDGSAKGGIAFSIQRQLGIPVKLVGLGEGITDFAFFDPAEFARGLVE